MGSRGKTLMHSCHKESATTNSQKLPFKTITWLIRNSIRSNKALTLACNSIKGRIMHCHPSIATSKTPWATQSSVASSSQWMKALSRWNGRSCEEKWSLGPSSRRWQCLRIFSTLPKCKEKTSRTCIVTSKSRITSQKKKTCDLKPRSNKFKLNWTRGTKN